MTLKFLPLNKWNIFPYLLILGLALCLLWPREREGSNSVQVLRLDLRRFHMLLFAHLCFAIPMRKFCLGQPAVPRRMKDIDHPRQVQMRGTNQNWPADCLFISWHFGTICHIAVITWHTLQSWFSVLGWRRCSYPTVAPEFQTSVPRIPLPNHKRSPWTNNKSGDSASHLQ